MSRSTLSYRFLGSTALLTAMIAGGGGIAHAQTTGAATGASNSQVEEIIVTANKREETLSRVGLTATAIGEVQLQQRNVTTLSDLANQVPGLNFTQTAHATPVYTLRGIGFYDTSFASYPAVSVYLDQAPLALPLQTTLTLFDLERVEVLKGPQGTLFGNNATGGAINYIAAKPTDEFEAGVTLDYASFNTASVDAHVSGPVADHLLGRLAIRSVHGDGWQESISRPGDKAGAPESFAARLLFDWTPTEALRIQTNFNGWIDRGEPQQAQFVQFVPSFPTVNPLPIPFTPNAVNDAEKADWDSTFPPAADNRLAQAAVRVDYNFSNSLVLTAITSYVDYKQRMVPAGGGLAAERITVDRSNGYIRSFSQEVRLADNASPDFRWTVGANYSHDRTFEDNDTAQSDGTPAFTFAFAGIPFLGNQFINKQVMNNYAVFATGEYTLNDFTLHAGARYTESQRDSMNCNLGYTLGAASGQPNGILDFFNFLEQNVFMTGVTYPPGTCTIIASDFSLHTFNGTLNEDNVSWRVGLDWKPTDTFLAYVNVAQGYKAGSFPGLSGSADIAYTPVTQESVLTYEGGVKATLFERRLQLNLSAFDSIYEDKQIRSKLIDPIFGPLEALVNIPESEIRGIELELTAQPAAGLTMGAAVTYLDAKLTDANGIVSSGNLTGNWTGNPIPYTSDWNIGLSMNYTHPIGDDNDAFVGVQYNYRSQATTSIDNLPVFTLPDYETIDLQAGLDFSNGRYRVMAWGKNVADEFYLINVVQYSDGIERFTGRPATYGVTLSARF